ncbi:MAG TPA: glycosyltransferase family 87 protein [Bacteroidota bacterium]|nr:glycosyltransferase family 87 protein [Bacteroidota bacterium]
MTRGVALIAIVVLSAFLLFRGVIPGLARIDTDFPNYYTAARLLTNGAPTERLYDDGWFQQQIFDSGIQQQGKFSPYPPITALVMVPFVFLGPLNALRAWTVLNLGCLILEIILLSRATGKSLDWSSLLILASGHALANNFRFGQFYLVLAVLVTSGYLLWQHHRAFATGALFGTAAAIKYFPILFVILFLLRREWRPAVAQFSTIFLLSALAVAVMGFRVHELFISTVLGKHLTGTIQDPFSPAFQSWNSLFRRLFVFDPVFNPSPFLRAPALFVILTVMVTTGVAALFVNGYRKAAFSFGPAASSIQFAFLNIAGLLLLPASATYHFLLLALPAAILLAFPEWSFEQVLVAGFYLAIGFLPYGALSRFQDSGLLTVLAYPRLILMTGIFVATYIFIVNHRAPGPSFRFAVGTEK